MYPSSKILGMAAATLLAGMLFMPSPVHAGKAKQAAGFSFTDQHGKKVHLADYRGKWVLVNFWAPWCPLCKAEVPHLNHIDASRDIAVVGVAMDYGPDSSHAEQMAKSMAYANVMGGNRREGDNAASQVGPVNFYPTSYLYNPKGERVAQLSGMVDEARVRQAMQKAGQAGR